MNQNFDYTPQNGNSSFQPPYPGQYPVQPPVGHAKGFATASLCLGIASIVCSCMCCCLYYIALPLSVLSIVMAFLARRDNGKKMPGMAVAGMILAIIGLLLFICCVAFEIILAQIPDEQMAAMLDDFFQEYYGMSYEEFLSQINSQEFQ